MANARERVENLEYRIEQTKKLLNVQDKKTPAYSVVKKDMDGLKSSLRVAKSALKTEIDKLNRLIKLARMQLNASPHPSEKLQCQKEIQRLQAELKKLKG